MTSARGRGSTPRAEGEAAADERSDIHRPVRTPDGALRQVAEGVDQVQGAGGEVAVGLRRSERGDHGGPHAQGRIGERALGPAQPDPDDPGKTGAQALGGDGGEHVDGAGRGLDNAEREDRAGAPPGVVGLAEEERGEREHRAGDDQLGAHRRTGVVGADGGRRGVGDGVGRRHRGAPEARRRNGLGAGSSMQS